MTKSKLLWITLVPIVSILLYFFTTNNFIMGAFLVLGLLILVFLFGKDEIKISKFSLMTLMLTITFQLGKIGALIIGLIIVLEVIKMIRSEGSMRISFDIIFLFFWFLYACFQLLWVVQTDRTFGHVQSIALGLVIVILLFNLIKTDNDLEYLMNYWIYAIFASLIVAYWEVFTGNHLPASNFNHNFVTTYSTVGFANPNDYSFLLGMSVPVMLYWFSKNGFYRIFSLFLILASIYIIYINDTRSVLAFVIITLIMYAFRILRTRKAKVVISLILFSIMTIFIFRNAVINMFFVLTSIDLSTDRSFYARQAVISNALEVFEKNILFGVGPGNIEFYLYGPIKNLHNFWIEQLANYGLLFFVLFVIFYCLCLYKLMKASKNNMKIWVLMCVMLLFIPLSGTSSSIFQFFITWFIFGLAITGKEVAKSNLKNQISN